MTHQLSGFGEAPHPFLYSAEQADAESQAAARAVINLFARWGLSDAQACILLGGISPRTHARWKAGDFGRIPRDLQARLSNLLGIHKALRIIFREPDRAYSWVSTANAAFSGRPALQVMLDGEITDIARVRGYLDAERGLW